MADCLDSDGEVFYKEWWLRTASSPRGEKKKERVSSNLSVPGELLPEGSSIDVGFE